MSYFQLFDGAKKEVLLNLLEFSGSNYFWQSEERGFLFDLFKDQSLMRDYLSIFEERVNKVIKNRSKKIMHKGVALVDTTGRYLLFDPSSTMYDGLTQDMSSGFFDSCDMPPPELWIGIENGKVVSFVPSEYIDIANIGVDACLGGCLEWAPV